MLETRRTPQAQAMSLGNSTNQPATAILAGHVTSLQYKHEEWYYQRHVAATVCGTATCRVQAWRLTGLLPVTIPSAEV